MTAHVGVSAEGCTGSHASTDSRALHVHFYPDRGAFRGDKVFCRAHMQGILSTEEKWFLNS